MDNFFKTVDNFDKFRHKNSTKYCIIIIEVISMEEAYEKSLQMIKEKNINNIKEYTKLAKEENLLNPVSLEYISRKEFNNLLKEMRR